MEVTAKSVGDYLRNDVSKADQPEAADRFNELVDQFAWAHKCEH